MTLMCTLFVLILCQLIIIGQSCLTVNWRDDLSPTTIVPVNNTNAFTFQGNAVSSYLSHSICSGNPGEVNKAIINQCINSNQYNVKLHSIDFNYQFSIGYCRDFGKSKTSSRFPIFHIHFKNLNGTTDNILYIKVFTPNEVDLYCYNDTEPGGQIETYSPLQRNHIDIDMDLGISDYQLELEFSNRDYNFYLYYDTLSLQINWSTENPTASPSKYPTNTPTLHPSKYPTNVPTIHPSKYPSDYPTISPLVHPTYAPSNYPSHLPTLYPTDYTNHPTVSPTTRQTNDDHKYHTEQPLDATKNPSQYPTNTPIIGPVSDETLFPTLDLYIPRYTSRYTSTDAQNIDTPGLYTTDDEEAISVSEQSDESKIPVTIIAVAVICIICCIAALFVFFVFYRKRKQQNQDFKNVNTDDEITRLTDNEVGKTVIGNTKRTQMQDGGTLSIANSGRTDTFDSNEGDAVYDDDNSSIHVGYMDYNRVDEEDKDDEDNEPYHEKQEWEMCLVHALNGLLQSKQFTVKRMNEICKELAPNKLINPHKSLLQTGNYDANVLMMALTKVDIDVEWFDARKVNEFDLNNDTFLKYLEPDNKKFVGFILNNPQKAMFKIFTRRHWIAIKEINDIWYNLDSKLKRPYQYKNTEELNEFMADNLSKNNAELMICRKENKYITKKVEIN